MVDVSIIIPTKDNEALIDKCLSSIARLEYDKSKIEVIVVDGHSTDRTVKVAEKYGCRVLEENIGNQAGAYNVGLKAAKGKYIVFTDADCIVPADWLINLTRWLDDKHIVSAGGPNLTPNDDADLAKCAGSVLTFLSKAGARYGQNATSMTETFHNPTCNVAYIKEVLDELGGFNESLVTCADEELDFRIKTKGYKIVYDPDAKVFHYRKMGFKKFATQAFKYAVGRAQAIKLHPKMARWFHFAPFLAITLILCSLLLSPFNSFFFLIAFSTVVIGVLGIGLMSFYISLKMELNKVINIFRCFALITIWLLGYGFGFIKGLAT